MPSLADKYRPTTFSEIRGNENLKSIISRTLKKENKPQTYILQGVRGCGKTTLSRIMAEKLGAVGRDIKELNISDMRGIDTARSIIENVGYMPVEGESKVIILNEVHRATGEFKDAMLEKLEEPPPNVYFILCTTEPQKLTKTVLSRCALKNYSVKKLKRRDMIQLVTDTLKAEEVVWERGQVSKLVRVVDGVPREALILLDTLIELKGRRLDKALNEIVILTDEVPIELIRAVNSRESWKTIGGLLRRLGSEVDVEGVRWTMLKYMRQVLLNNPSPEAAFTIECFEDSFAESGLAGLYLACYKALNL